MPGHCNPIARGGRSGGMRRLLALAVLALAVPAASAADTPQLVGSVGPGFSIRLIAADGSSISHLDPGRYSILVHDLSDEHDFHLVGPGVDVTTDVDFVGDKTLAVTLTDGTYRYQCDPHASIMKGSFTVGAVAATPAPTVKPAPKPKPKPKPKKKPAPKKR